jgi:histidinol dehydrogenase
MRLLHWPQLTPAERRAALARPALEERADIDAAVAGIIAAVRAGGDEALRAFTRRFDQAEVAVAEVTPAEFRAAREALAPEEHAALERAYTNIRAFHAAQVPAPIALETEPGVRCERLWRPYQAVGLYVPAGTAPLPSAVLMLGVPAQLAGCPLRVLCTPPGPAGRAAAAVLVAAELCGITTAYAVGGAQAIAALAYGTQRIPKVDKIFGPGNVWVTAAKQQVARDPHGAACDLPAGPSEVMVIADEAADPEFVAADLLAQAEHDVLAQALLVTPSEPLAAQVRAAIARALPQLARRAILARSLAHCRCLIVQDLEQALAVANAYAPEHLLLSVRGARECLPHVQHAGAVFLGPWSSEPLGDYCAGPNHVLPTYGYARRASGLALTDFMRTLTVQEVSPAGLRALGPTAITLAGLEGLSAHAAAVRCRLAALTAGAAA